MRYQTTISGMNADSGGFGLQNALRKAGLQFGALIAIRCCTEGRTTRTLKKRNDAILKNRNVMHRTALILIFCSACFAGATAAADSAADPYDYIPHKNTPRKLQEAWLRFHESDLCQNVDAAFVFENTEMQIWSRIESDKDYSKFQRLFEPLRSPYRVKLYTNRPRQGKGIDSGDNPPPSLWQNYELRANLGDRVGQLSTFGEDRIVIIPPSDPVLKQRLFIFAEQMLSQNRKMGRYALDIFALARFSADPDIPADIRSKAIAIGSAHTKALAKCLGRLASELEQAIPRTPRGESRSFAPATPDTAAKPVLEEAEQIYSKTQSIALRIHSFIYPEDYTVALEELRNPSLLATVRTFQQTVLKFQKTLVKSGRK